MQFLERNHIAMVATFIADSYDGGRVTKPLNHKNYDHVCYVVVHGTGTLGRADIVAQACDDAAAANPIAIPFRYRKITGANAADIWQDPATALAAGIATDAGSHQLYLVEIDSAELKQAGQTKPFSRLTLGEHTDGAVIGGVIAILSRPRHKQSVPQTAFS